MSSSEARAHSKAAAGLRPTAGERGVRHGISPLPAALSSLSAGETDLNRSLSQPLGSGCTETPLISPRVSHSARLQVYFAAPPAL